MEYALTINRQARETDWLLWQLDTEDLPDALAAALKRNAPSPVALDAEDADRVRGWMYAARAFGHSDHGIDLTERH